MSEQLNAYGTNEAFYLHGGVRLPEYIAINGDDDRTVTLHAKTPLLEPQGILDNASLDDAMREIAMSRTALEYGDDSFDIGVANAHATKGTIALNATANSALDNVGNGYEMAALAVRYPDYRIVYIGSPGKGAGSPMPKEDAAYYKQYGRLVRGEGDDAHAVSYVQNMNRALVNHGIEVTHLSADSTGNQYGQALGVELEPGQLEAAHLSESTGFVNLGRIAVGYGMVYKEDRKNTAWNIERSFDPEKLTDEMQARYRKSVELYASKAAMSKIDRLRPSIAGQASAFWTNFNGLRRGPKNGIHPLAQDATALLARQPQARLVYSLGELDPLYQDVQVAHNAARKFVGNLVLPQSADVRMVLIPDMTHKTNTYFPELYHAIKRYALFGREAA